MRASCLLTVEYCAFTRSANASKMDSCAAICASDRPGLDAAAPSAAAGAPPDSTAEMAAVDDDGAAPRAESGAIGGNAGGGEKGRADVGPLAGLEEDDADDG